MYPTLSLTYYYPYPSQYLSLPLHYPYSSPYLLPWASLEVWGQGVPFDSQILLWGCYLLLANSARRGVGYAHVLSNTEYFNVLLEVGGGAWPPPPPPPPPPPRDAHDLLPLLLPLPTTTPTPPLKYYYLYSTIPLVHGVRLNGHVCDDDKFTESLLSEYETYLHGYCLQVELTQIT